MIPNPHFEDYDEPQFRRHVRAVEGREKVAAPADEVTALAVDYNYTTASANLLLAEHDCPPELRPVIDAIVGVCGDRVDEWFEASDKVLAKHANRSDKWVQTWRKELLAWMKRCNVAIIDIEDHKWQHGEVPKPHKYRVNLSRLVAAATLEAQNMPEWKVHKGEAMEISAKNVKDSLPQVVTHKQRRCRHRDDAQTTIEGKIKGATNAIRRALEIQQATGNNVRISAELVAELKRAVAELEGHADGPISTTYEEEVLDTARCESEPDDHVEAETSPAGESARGGVVENFSTTLGPVNSTTYEKTARRLTFVPDVPAHVPIEETEAYLRGSPPGRVSVVCSYCESVGHTDNPCPFRGMNSDSVEEIARKRRERRAREGSCHAFA
jgi:hypothetical protein